MKKSKSILIDIIEFLKKETGKTQGELSIGAGYAPETLAQMKSKSSGHDAVVEQLKIAYRDVLKNSIYKVEDNTLVVEEPEMLWQKQKLPDKDIEKDLLKKRVEDLEKIISLQQEVIETAKKKSTQKDLKNSAA